LNHQDTKGTKKTKVKDISLNQQSHVFAVLGALGVLVVKQLLNLSFVRMTNARSYLINLIASQLTRLGDGLDRLGFSEAFLFHQLS